MRLGLLSARHVHRRELHIVMTYCCYQVLPQRCVRYIARNRRATEKILWLRLNAIWSIHKEAWNPGAFWIEITASRSPQRRMAVKSL